MIVMTIPGKPFAQLDFRPVPGYEHSYAVAGCGCVLSLKRVVKRRDGFTQSYPQKILKQTVGTHGYPAVALCNGGARGVTRTVHSIVADAFLGPRPSGHEVRHLDGNRENPCVTNLEYATNTVNQHDRRVHGTHNFGDRNPISKLTQGQVSEIKSLKGTRVSSRVAGKRFNVSSATILDIWKGRTWTR